MMPRGRALLLASIVPYLAGCLSDLAVGFSELESEEPATSADDAGDRDKRDATTPATGARDAGALDARVSGDAATCGEEPCADRDAGMRDASVARDASSPRDAATRDAATRDAASRDASAADAGEQCVPSDCEYVGLVVTFLSCEMGKEPVCTLTDKGICDLVCAAGPISTGPAAEDAAMPGGDLKTKPDAGRDARTAGDAETLQEDGSVDGAVSEQDGAVTAEAGADAQVVERDE